jgi:hypothetical protein
MNTSGALLTMIDERAAVSPLIEQDQTRVQRFLSLALQGLPPMLDQQRRLFCFRLRRTDQGMVREGISHRYTAMTLMGLHRLIQAGGYSPIDTEPVFQALFSDLKWVDNIGDLGVLLWLCGVACPERFGELERRLEPQSALERYKGAKRGVTMELGWFLTGLAYWAQVCPERLPQLEPIVFKTYNILTKNQRESGFFGHLATSGSISGMLRGRIGSFADQVYPIYGMTQFAKAYSNEEAAKRATKCAIGLCEAQGPSGQWWWHYDAVGGRVTDGYPVFSVHQHAMGPMTLFGLEKVTQQDFDPWIYKGLRWINSNNESNFDMEDSSNGVIWRCIYRSRRSFARYFKAGLGHYSEKAEHDRPEDLKILFECRPYELGWLLYAFAPRP